MPISLSDHFSYRRLIQFTLPSVVMMLFSSIYGVVDGFFISNIEGETAFAAVNLIMPYCMIFSSLGFMLGTGGSALVAYIRGQGDNKRANSIFSMLVYIMLCGGVVLTVVAELFIPKTALFFGATGDIYTLAVIYSRIFLLSLPAFMLQLAFQTLLVTAERPKLGLVFTIGAGVTNMILDWLFIAVFRWGVAGAAAATCIGQCIGGIGPLFFFAFSKTSSLRLGKAEFNGHDLLKACSNGMAEFITNIAINVVSMVYNYQLLKYIGDIGVSAYGVIMYVNLIFIGVYIGYSMGTAPLFSYHYGAENYMELKNLFSRSIKLMLGASFILSLLSVFCARGIAFVFAGYEATFLNTSTTALRIFSVSYIFAGINIFAANLFAALNNGTISTILSGLRMFAFQLAAVLLLPIVFGAVGIWWAMPCSEFLVCVLSVIVLWEKRARYQY